MYRASDGYLLQYRHWSVAGSSPRARIVALHGIQSHSGWYTYSSRRLAEAGYEVFFLDRRGAGLNRCSRGHAVHSERLINDVVQFLTQLHHQQTITATQRPIVLLGVSWGGKLAAAVAQRHSHLLSAVALLYPGIFSKMNPRIRDLWKLKFIEDVGWGQELIPIPLNDPNLFTNNPEWQERIRRDELALLTATVSFLLSSQQLTALLTADRNRARPAIALPALLMLAGQDEIIDNSRTRAWFEHWAATPRTIIEYPEARHTLEFEPNRDRFIDDLIAWLGRVIPPNQPSANSLSSSSS